MVYVLSFIFGASIGSFVEVLVTRLHVAPVFAARSKCLSCGEALRAYDLIPVLSYFLLRGKCRYCKTPYGVWSLCIEVLYGGLFVMLAHALTAFGTTTLSSLSWFLYYTLLFIVFGIIALYDWKHMRIPMWYLAGYLLLTMAMLGIRITHEPSLLTFFSSLAVTLPFLVLFFMTRGRALGFGDVLLFLGVGAFFGFAQGIAVFLLSVWIGAVAGVGMYLFKKKNGTLSTAMPFGPFVIIAFLIVLFTDIDIFSIASLFA